MACTSSLLFCAISTASLPSPQRGIEQIPALRPESSIRRCDKLAGVSAAARHAGSRLDNNKVPMNTSCP